MPVNRCTCSLCVFRGGCPLMVEWRAGELLGLGLTLGIGFSGAGAIGVCVFYLGVFTCARDRRLSSMFGGMRLGLDIDLGLLHSIGHGFGECCVLCLFTCLFCRLKCEQHILTVVVIYADWPFAKVCQVIPFFHALFIQMELYPSSVVQRNNPCLLILNTQRIVVFSVWN